MMSPSSYIAFVAAAVALILLPGPNVALIVGTSLAGGPRAGLASVAGTLCATVGQLALVFAGLTLLLTQASHLFAVLRWLGAAYLFVLGLRLFFATAEREPRPMAARSSGQAFWRGFAVSLTNPKTLFFYGAFLPQFVDRAGSVPTQMAALAATYLALSATLDSGWALLASRLRGLLERRARLQQRLTGGSMMAAALGLVLAREPV